jgi:hypothetical protein
MAYVVFVHGLDNKPESAYLHQLWKRKLGHDNGIDLDANGVSGAMVYWADVFYPEPDTNLAAYERAAGDIELCGAPPDPWSPEGTSPEDLTRVRRLAERFGVDLAAARTVEPGADEIAAVQQERVPVPEWLRNRVMQRLVRDAHHYFFNLETAPRTGARYRARDEIRRRFVEALKAGDDRRPLIAVTHSMGTMIAYDCLKHVAGCPPLDGLITIGSPLGLDEVQDFYPSWSRDDGFPSETLQGPWVNVYDPLDVVAGLQPRLAPDFRRRGDPVVDDVREDNWGTWRHSISKYLQGRSLRGHVSRLLSMDWP